jgi:ABC-type glycerol-3-phosphate transport system substrate-binding protein
MRSTQGGSFRPIKLLVIAVSLVLSACAPTPTPYSPPTRSSNAPVGTMIPPTVIETRAEVFGFPLAQDDTARLYRKPSVLLRQGDSVQFEVATPTEAEYTIAFDSAAEPSVLSAPEGQLRIDDEFPISDLQRVVFPIYYRNSTSTTPKDRYGNDALIRQVRDVRWTKTHARDVNLALSYPLRVKLSAGKHRLALTLTEGALYLGSVYLTTFAPYPDYAQYLAAQTVPNSTDFLQALEAENPAYKNDTSVRPTNSRDLTVSPYDTYRLLLNTLGGESWHKSGSTAYYTVNVPQDGLYALTLRVQQNTRNNFTVFRRITINDEVPFEQFNAVPFPQVSEWTNIPLGGANPYRVFLRQGVNTIGIEATNAPYHPAIVTIQKALLDINTLALEIRKLTGNQRDQYKEWVISNFIPDIRERLNTIARNLTDDKSILLDINQSGASPEILAYQMAIDNLLFLAADPDKIPIYMSRLSEGTGSASQLLGSLLPLLQKQPLALDRIYVHSPNRTPENPAAPLTTTLAEGVKRFTHSFSPDPYQSLAADANELEVWVNRPRQYVDLLQLLADESFTPQTGIRVKFSIMPEEGKLILANAADIQPDIALGVSTGNPYELAIRNALYDLRTFDDFDSFIRIYSPGALLGYIIDDSVYAIPETQDFWVTYYRKDILNSIGVPVPRTWNDVIRVLPELQRYGMNYNTALSNGAGQKGYLVTAPYIFNYGAALYSDDGFATGLESEAAVAAVKFMADSFTLYGMPLTTSNFYESFRYGTLPVGISNFTDYIKFTTLAPEIGGLWAIDLYPATVLPDGTQNRYATGSAQTSIMFKRTNKPKEGWQFLKWWMSTETQVEFQERLLLNFGREFLWNSANLEAFARLDIPGEHKAVILEQWKWMQEPVRLPGSYMQERELSNVWNRIVFDGVNPRVAIDRSVTIINREITRKMDEFGYLKDGQRVRAFNIPTIASVTAWMNNANSTNNTSGTNGTNSTNSATNTDDTK